MEEIVYCKICTKKCCDTMELKIHIESHRKRPRTDDAGLPIFKYLKKNDDELTKSLKQNGDRLSTESFEKNNDNDDEPTTNSSAKKDESPTTSLNEDSQYESFNYYNRLERKYVECDVCQEICYDESTLRKHCEIHLSQNVTKCGVCAQDFKSVYTLHQHFKTHSSTLYSCNKCDREFKSKESLSRHVCRAFPCNVCSKVFQSKDELLKHFFIHQSLQGSYLHFN